MPEFFLSACERHFRFLETEHNFSYISGLVDYKNGRVVIKPFFYESSTFKTKTASNEQAITLYEKALTSLEIYYLARQGTLEITIGYDGIQRFDLGQLLQTARIPVKQILPCLEQDDLTNALEYLGTLVKNHSDIILKPDPALLQKAIIAQEKIMEQKIRAKFQSDLDDASQQAARAFVKKDYRRVIELLMPYENHLGNTDMNKLALSKKEILKV